MRTSAACPPTIPLESGQAAGSGCDIGAYERSSCLGVLINRVGTTGNDTITGGSGNDGILALAGNGTTTSLSASAPDCHHDMRTAGGVGPKKALAAIDSDQRLDYPQ